MTGLILRHCVRKKRVFITQDTLRTEKHFAGLRYKDLWRLRDPQPQLDGKYYRIRIEVHGK